MVDSVRFAYWLGLFASLLGVICLIWVVRANAGSRTLVLGVGTLSGAFLLFAIQLIFELQPTTTNDAFGAEFTTDHAIPEIRRPTQDLHSFSLFVETEASKTLAAANADAFNEHTDKLTRDMVLFSLIGFVAHEHFDWQLRQARFKSQLGIAMRSAGASKAEECTPISEEQLREKLANVGNAFAGTKSFAMGRGLCLPPRSVIEIEANALRLKTPVCEIAFNIEAPFVQMHHLEPGFSDTSHMPILANGKPRFDTILVGIHAAITFDPYRAQNWELKKYQDWSNGILEGAKRWFEGA